MKNNFCFDFDCIKKDFHLSAGGLPQRYEIDGEQPG